MASLAAAGYGTANIEREHAGGSCVDEGYIPTMMVASARAGCLTRRASDHGIGIARPA